MSRRTWIPLAAALALVGAASRAQIPPTGASPGLGASGGSAPALNAGAGQQPFTFNGATFQFMPGTGFVPLGTPGATAAPAPPALGAIGSPMFQFVQGVGFVAVTPGASAFLPTGNFAQSPFYFYFSPGTGFVPYGAQVVAGPNGVPVRLVPVPVVVSAPARSRRGGAAAVRNREVSEAAADPQQLRMTREMQDLMRTHAMVSGQMVHAGPEGVLVKFQVNGESHTETFPAHQVYFFYRKPQPTNAEMAAGQGARTTALSNAGGVMPQTDHVLLATARTNASALQFGSQVLVPVPLSAMRGESVAGTREERPARTRTSPGEASGAGASAPGAGPVTPTNPAAVAPPPSATVRINPAHARRVVLVPAGAPAGASVRTSVRNTGVRRGARKRSTRRRTKRHHSRRDSMRR